MKFVEFGEKLQEIRDSLNLSRDDVFKETGISIEALRKIEKAMQEPKIKTLELLSKCYKVDLLSLIGRYRLDTSVFSISLTNKINKHLNSGDYRSLKDEIISLVQEDLVQAKKKDNKKEIEQIANLFNAFKEVDKTKLRHAEKIVIYLEQYLAYSRIQRKYAFNTVNYSNLELIAINFLIAAYRNNDQHDKGIQLALTIKKDLVDFKLLNTYQISSYTYACLNYIYILHHQERYEEVLETIDELFSNKLIRFSRHNLVELFYRKSIALYYLNDPQYLSYVQVVLDTCPESKRDMYLNSYQVTHEMEL